MNKTHYLSRAEAIRGKGGRRNTRGSYCHRKLGECVKQQFVLAAGEGVVFCMADRCRALEAVV